MYRHILNIFRSIFPVLFLVLYSTTSPAALPENPDRQINDDIAALDKLHQEFSAVMHEKLINARTLDFRKVNNIKQLENQVKSLVKHNQSVVAANLILFNIGFLERNYDNLVIFDFIDLLLKQNEIKGATRLFNLLQKEGDRTLHSNAAFYFARHYYVRKKWNKVLTLLKDTINDLAPAELHEALLMQGIALQNKLNHRAAIKSYSRIPPSSYVYIPARLNLAIANIRQGWWTDAHTIINELLNSQLPLKNEESINRLYLTLGYSLLHKEYYRNSREAFRNVGLKSRYANRALLGLSLTAANQNDYVGALNAVRVLKNSTNHDLIMDESYFLMPYLYEKLQQHTTASAGYTEAISYYDNKIAHINEIINASHEMYKYALIMDTRGRVKFDDFLVDLSEKYPVYIVDNYSNLGSYSAVIDKLGDKNITIRFNNLMDKYANLLHDMIRSLLRQRIRYLNSYKDQSRYGLARLYDNNLATNN